ncbi:MAG: serine hydrolase domain-containing protein [Cytophagaceae bacterium]
MVAFYLFSCSGSKENSPGTENPAISASMVSAVEQPETTLDESALTKASKIDKLCNSLVNSKQFNGCVLISENNKIIYKNCKGYSDFKNKIELTDSSAFHLASVSKQFTAMAIMLLYEEGKLSYDDDVQKWLPELPYEGITVRHLLLHTSGVPNILNYVPYYITFWDSCEMARNHDLVEIYKNKKPRRQGKPGSRFSYNNSGYVLLALIVERISGMSFKEFVEQRIFTPLQMTHSFVIDVEKEAANKVKCYGPYRRGGYAPDDNDVRNGFTGEKGIYCSAIDLYKWDQALTNHRLVKKETLEEAFSNGRLSNGKEIPYGFGWRKSRKNKNLIYHFGHWRGAKTCIIRFPEQNNCIIILNNTSSSRIKSLAMSIAKVLNNGGAVEL